jgi:hypothetical protein
MDNPVYAIGETVSGADIWADSCLFFANPDGDFLDEGTTLYTGANDINIYIPEAIDNKTGDPVFAGGKSGVWSTVSPPQYDAASNRTILTVDTAMFTPDELAGRLLSADLAGPRQQVYVTTNSETVVEVVGNVTGFVQGGDAVVVLDDHLSGESAAVDLGVGPAAEIPTEDLDGNARGYDVPYLPPGIGVRTYDIGAYEMVPIFEDGFESGDLSRWSVSVTGS